jgi:hypothetical protein
MIAIICVRPEDRARGGFIQQQIARLQHQRPGNGDAFFLPVAEALNRLMAKPCASTSVSASSVRRAISSSATPILRRAKSDIAVDIGIENLLIGILKHGRHLLAQRQQPALAVIQRFSLPQHRPLLRAQHTAQVHKQRRFPQPFAPTSPVTAGGKNPALALSEPALPDSETTDRSVASILILTGENHPDRV